MKTLSVPLILMCALCISTVTVRSQFDVSAYKRFLDTTKNYDYKDLQQRFDAGSFLKSAPADLSTAQFFDMGDTKYKFTSGEKALLEKHSFVVSDRLKKPDFNAWFYDIYRKDLPVFISSDAILNATHTSFDNILSDLEQHSLSYHLDTTLRAMHSILLSDKQLPPTDSLSLQASLDADLYLCMALKLLNEHDTATISPCYTENSSQMDGLLQAIELLQPSSVQLFSQSWRLVDWSMFKLRGHYDKPTPSRLPSYFKAMMWLGRTEIYIEKPISASQVSDADIRRQCALSIYLSTLLLRSGAYEAHYSLVDKCIQAFAGPQDNLKQADLLSIIESNKLSVSSMSNDSLLLLFQKQARDAGAEQRILSQLLESNGKDTVKPAPAFLFLGQRFVIDSYVFGQLVADQVKLRLMPKPLDAMFALGNNAALQYLADDVNRYSYAPNLAAIRYMIDSYVQDGWYNSVYTSRLDVLRHLNPPTEGLRASLPLHMQTAAWWQKNLNTQLAAWAELRHDYLLYAKQPYTTISACFYPKGYVEPMPSLYRRLSAICTRLEPIVDSCYVKDLSPSLHSSLRTMAQICERLASLADKELMHLAFSTDDEELISNWISKESDCDIVYYRGYYPQLQYGMNPHVLKSFETGFCVADVHTQPSDESGSLVGKVLHVATGAPNLAVVIAKDIDDCSTAYFGPVYSYYEYVTQNFQRLSDQEWSELYHSTSMRPSLTRLYMTDTLGELQSPGANLVMDVIENSVTSTVQSFVSPNPVRSSALFAFIVPQNREGAECTLKVYDSQGQCVATVVHARVSSGNYLARWDASANNHVANGTYIYTLQLGEDLVSGKLVVDR